jgi:hypothetical protein
MKTPRYPIRPRIRGIGRGTERVGEFEVLRRSTPRQTRRSPPRHWPVLPPVAVPIHLTGALRTQPPSGRLRRCPDATRSPTRCAVRAVPAGSGQSLVVFLRSRRCSYRQKLLPCVGIDVPELHFRWPVLKRPSLAAGHEVGLAAQSRIINRPIGEAKYLAPRLSSPSASRFAGELSC